MGESRRRNGEKAESILAKVEKRNTGSLRFLGVRRELDKGQRQKGVRGKLEKRTPIPTGVCVTKEGNQ